MHRRQFIGAGLSLSAILALQACASSRDEREKPQAKRLLVLGGTRFIGPPIVDAALERGWEVTLFNRGKTNPELFPQCEKLRGDRDGDMSALEGREWDAVIDTLTDMPRHVRSAAKLLAD